MEGVQIHQLLHGYRRGHQLLAGSRGLPSNLSELVTRLSDLSGLQTGDGDFESYLTSYPLPGGDFYALAKTWPDHQASRSGCVLTHTLLIPQETWASASNPTDFAHLFIYPDGDLDRYKSAITKEVFLSRSASSLSPPRLNVAIQFVGKYFGEGLRPVVWFGQDCPEDIFWLLVKALWPNVRRSFACCTYSLQPRELDERPFDLLFAPSKVYSRFNKISSDNIIEVSSSSTRTPSNDKEQAWFLDLAQVIFNRNDAVHLAEEFDEFKSLLNEEPTSVRNFFLIRNLQERTRESATAGVGLMDIVASLAPGEQEILEFKKNVVSLALKAAHDASDVDESLKCYFLISERLEQQAYKSVRREIFEELQSKVCSLTGKNPEAAIGAGERLFSRSRSSSSSAYAFGLVSGLQQLAKDAPNELRVLHRFPVTAGVIVVNEPEIARGYLRGMKGGQEDFFASADLSSWLASVNVPETKAKLRAALLPEIRGDKDLPLAEQILRDASANEVSDILDILSMTTSGFRSSALRNVIIEIIAKNYPSELRYWSDSSKVWTEGVAAVVAATYENTVNGFRELLEETSWAPLRKTQVLTAYLDNISASSLPLWFKDYARRHADFLVPLMKLGKDTPERTSKILQRVFIEVKDIPIAEEHNLREAMPNFTDAPFGNQLIDTAMRSSITGFIAGQLEPQEFDKWQNPTWASEWFTSVNSWELQALVNNSCRDRSSWIRAWEWLAHAPDSLFWRPSPVATKIVDSLISAKRYQWDWTLHITECWVEILKRAGEKKHSSMFLELCATALGFAFNHKDYPLSAVVAESFWPIYSTMLNTEVTASSGFLFGILSWLDWDWDKAKDLRKKLVASFLYSNWPPGDLALAAREQTLLRKLFKRVIKSRNGEVYVESMIKDLVKRNTHEAKALAKELTSLLRNPDFHEPWD